MLLLPFLLSLTLQYFCYSFSHNNSLWFKRQLIQLLQIIITIWIYGKEIYFDMLLTFGIHVSADTHLYSRLVIILPTYFWTSTLLYNVSAEANCFLRFIKFVIALATPTLRISFCWSWTRALFSELKVGVHLRLLVAVNFVHFVHRIFEYYILWQHFVQLVMRWSNIQKKTFISSLNWSIT